MIKTKRRSKMNYGFSVKNVSKCALLAGILIGALNAQDQQSLQADTTKTDTDKKGKDSAVYDLGEIEVTAQNNVDNNATTTLISQEDIANSGSNDVAQALRFTPGVFYMPPNGSKSGADINIRGFGEERIGVTIDGIPVGSVYDRFTNYAIFDTWGFSQIQVSKGYTSPQYGMNTLGGAINMLSQKPTERLELGFKYGFISNNENQAGVSIGSNLGKYYFQASYSFVDRKTYPLSSGYTPSGFQTNREMRNSYVKSHTIKLKAGWQPNENHEYSLNLIYLTSQRGGTGSDTTQDSRLWSWGAYDKTTLYLLGRSKLTEKLSLHSRLYYDTSYNLLKNWNNVYDSLYDDFSVGGIFTFQMDFTQHNNLKLGLNLKNDNHTNPTDQWALWNRGSATPIGHTISYNKDIFRDLSTSIFGEYAHRFNDTLRFMVSASYDRNDMLYGLSRNLGNATSGYAITEERIDTNALQGGTLQAILYSDWNDSLQSWFNIGHKTTLPSLRQRFSAANGYLTPNPNLQPESAINVELGTKLDYDSESVAFSSTKAEVAVFYNDLTNMFVQTNDVSNACPNGASCSKFINAKEGYSYGVEVGFMQGFWDDKIKFGANYTYTQKKTTGAHFTNYDRILNYPNHIANAHFSISPIRVLDFILNVSYHSPRWSYSTTTGNYTQSIDIFLLDLKLNYRIISGLEASVGAYNLLDYNYYFNAGEYMPGRRIFVGLEYKF